MIPAGRNRQRRGAVMVEMAIVLPVLMLLLFAIVEFGWVMMVRQQLVLVARDAARFGTLPGVDEEAFQAHVAERLKALGLTNGIDGVRVAWTTFARNALAPDEIEAADATARAFFGFAGANRYDTLVTITVPYRRVSLVGFLYGRRNGDERNHWVIRAESWMRSELDSVDPNRIAQAIARGEF